MMHGLYGVLLAVHGVLLFCLAYAFHVVRMRIRERIAVVRCRLAHVDTNPDAADILVVRENLNKIEMLLDF